MGIKAGGSLRGVGSSSLSLASGVRKYGGEAKAPTPQHPVVFGESPSGGKASASEERESRIPDSHSL